MTQTTERTSFVWWLLLPFAFFAFNMFLQFFADDGFVNGLLTESGPIEIIQVIIICLAFFVAVACLPMAFRSKDKLIIGWFCAAALGTFYITGEEISWGQHYFLWSTPLDWIAVNDHHETNLHNTTSWLDQKPKTLLEIGMLIGAIILPLYRRKRPSSFLDKHALFLPPAYLWLTAALLWAIKLLKDADHYIHLFTLERTSELNETFIYYFMLLYLLALRLRLKRPPYALQKGA